MKNLKITLLAISTLFIASLNFQAVEKKFEVSNFKEIKAGTAFKIEIKQGDEYQVVATGEPEDLDDIIVSVRNQVLVLSLNNPNERNRGSINFEIICPTLEKADLSGASITRISDFKNMDVFSLKLSGASLLKMESDVMKFYADLSGASNLKLESSISQLNAKLSGASNFKLSDGAVQDAIIDASGASRIKFNVQKTLDVKASGASVVNFIGEPKIVAMSSSGASVINKAN